MSQFCQSWMKANLTHHLPRRFSPPHFIPSCTSSKDTVAHGDKSFVDRKPIFNFSSLILIFGTGNSSSKNMTFCTEDIVRSFTEDCHAGIYAGGVALV